MKITKIISVFLITTLFLPQINLARAEDKPDYVGVNVNDVLIWKVTIEPSEFEDILEDAGYSDAFIEDYSDAIFSGVWDKDVEGWKMVFIDMKEEKEFDYNGDEADGVVYYLNWYITEDYEEKDWKKEEMNERGRIVKYDKDFYTWRTLDRPFGMGLYYSIAANNINWEKLADEVDEELGDEYDGKDEEGSAKTAQSLYKVNGISTSINIDEEYFDDLDSVSQYNNNGVLMYYEWSYDGDPILILELEGHFFYEYWEVILGVAILGVVIVVVVVLIIKKRKR